MAACKEISPTKDIVNCLGSMVLSEDIRDVSSNDMELSSSIAKVGFDNFIYSLYHESMDEARYVYLY